MDKDNRPYKAPQRKTPHPNNTPINPYDKRELQQLNDIAEKRALIQVAKKIRSTEKQLEDQLSKLEETIKDDPRSITINVHRYRIRDPAKFPTAQRAKTSLSNLDSHYRKWANLCEQYCEKTHPNNNSS